MSRESIVIVGSGWAGFTVAHRLNDKKFDITVVSPEDTSPYTPLLASAACGHFDFSLAEEPIRRKNRDVKYLEAWVETVDFTAKVCKCRAACNIPGAELRRFDLPYDRLILTPGCVTNTFNTPGANEHCFFVRNVADAKKLQHRVKQLAELACLPGVTEEEQRALLHIIVVGGGATGVELSAELSDLFHDDFAALYPIIAGKFSITIHDAANFILGAFEEGLRQHTIGSFSKRDVGVITDSRIKEVAADSITTEAEGRIPCGLVLWTAGNKQSPLVDALDVAKTDKLPRMMTDEYLHVLDTNNEPMRDVYALGDAADVKKSFLPTTAEVATQKGIYLANMLNADVTTQKFEYKQKALVAYIGGYDGVVSGKPEWTGGRAWAAWRSKNLMWTRSWRRKVMIVMYWFMGFIGGNEIARS